MFRHVVLLRFTDDTTAKDVRTLTDALHALPARLPQIRDYRIGTDLGLAEENAHFAIVADFDDFTDYVVYRDDPEHQRVIAELIRPYLASRTAAQYEIELGRRVGAPPHHGRAIARLRTRRAVPR